MKLELLPRTDLAVRALRYLADGVTRNSEDLANAIDSTPQHMQHVMAPLTGAGWVRSRRGPSGGYTIDPAADPSILELIEAVEGPTADGQCVLRTSSCSEEMPCALHDAWVQARRALVEALGQRPVIEQPNPNDGGKE